MTMKALPLAAVLALVATQLGGCVAAAALVPLAAGGGVLRSSTSGSARDAAKTPVKPVVVVNAGPIEPAAAATATPPPPTPEAAPATAAIDDSGTPETPTLQVASGQLVVPPKPRGDEVLPPSRLAQDDAGYAVMTAFLLRALGDGKPVSGRLSALLDKRTLATVPRRLTCADQRPAVILDLDPGTTPFDLNDPPTPAPDLADHLRVLRGRGLAVLWLATLPQGAERNLGNILKATGLDPLGIDHMLLLGNGEARRQQILNRVHEDWCVLAVAGDRRADFDEVFDYLRNPDGPVALALEQNIGNGWFLVPLPIR